VSLLEPSSLPDEADSKRESILALWVLILTTTRHLTWVPGPTEHKPIGLQTAPLPRDPPLDFYSHNPMHHSGIRCHLFLEVFPHFQSAQFTSSILPKSPVLAWYIPVPKTFSPSLPLAVDCALSEGRDLHRAQCSKSSGSLLSSVDQLNLTTFHKLDLTSRQDLLHCKWRQHQFHPRQTTKTWRSPPPAPTHKPRSP
jgi:hypothetical protein